MFKKLDELYQSAPIEIKTKAPLLKTIDILLMLCSLPLLVLSLFAGNYQIMGGIGMVLLLAVLSLMFLYRGRYRGGVNVVVLGLIAAVLVVMHAPASDYVRTVAMSAIYSNCIILISLLLAPTRKTMTINVVVLIVNYFSLLLRLLLTPDLVLDSVAGIYFPALFCLIIVGGVAILARTVMEKISDDALWRMEESRRQTLQLSLLHGKAAEKLMKAQEMDNLSRETSGSSEKIKDSTSRISKQIESFAEKFSESRDALAQIEKMMGDMTDVSENQAANITETGAVMEEMIASIRNVSAVTEKRIQTVELLGQSADRGMKDMEETGASFGEVEKHLEQVKDMTSLILDLADQINLLGMNAAIEAARAGKEGNGFSVVAGEIRSLAESSARSAQKIEATVKLLMDSVVTTGSLVRKSGESFRGIHKNAEEVREAMSEVGMSIKEIAGGTGEVLKATSALNELTVQVVTSIQQTRESGDGAIENIKLLESFVNSLKESISIIEGDSLSINKVSSGLRDICKEINIFVKDFSVNGEEETDLVSA